MYLYASSVIRWIKEIPNRFTMQFFLIPDCFKTQRMCIKAVQEGPSSLSHVPDHLKTPEKSNEVMRIKPFLLGYVPHHLTTQEMCSEAFEKISMHAEIYPSSP